MHCLAQVLLLLTFWHSLDRTRENIGPEGKSRHQYASGGAGGTVGRRGSLMVKEPEAISSLSNTECCKRREANVKDTPIHTTIGPVPSLEHHTDKEHTDNRAKCRIHNERPVRRYRAWCWQDNRNVFALFLLSSSQSWFKTSEQWPGTDTISYRSHLWSESTLWKIHLSNYTKHLRHDEDMRHISLVQISPLHHRHCYKSRYRPSISSEIRGRNCSPDIF